MSIQKKILGLLVVTFFGYCGNPPPVTDNVQWLDTSSSTDLVAPKHVGIDTMNCAGYITMVWDKFDSTATDLIIERKKDGGEFEMIQDMPFDPNITTFIDHSYDCGIKTGSSDLNCTYRIKSVIKAKNGSIDETSDYSNETNGPVDYDSTMC